VKPFAALIRDIDKVRRKQKKTIADVAREIGLRHPNAKGSGYVQLYKWLTGRVTPKGENVMKLSRWLEQQKRSKSGNGQENKDN